MNKWKYKSKILLIVILFMSIGFALLSSSLDINGLINFDSKWNVYFDNIQIISNTIEANNPIISSNKNSISFEGVFSSPSDIFSFSVDVVNDGNIRAMLDLLSKNGISDSNKDYINYEVTYYDGSEIRKNDLLKSGSRVRIIVKVEYKYDVVDLISSGNQNFSLEMTYVSATKAAVDRGVDLNLNSSSNLVSVLKSSGKKQIKGIRILGNTYQNKYSYINYYNYKDVCTDSVCVSEGITIKDGGWITISYDNTSGTETVYQNYFTNNISLMGNNTYNLAIEVERSSGNGILKITSHQGDEGQLPEWSRSISQLMTEHKYYKSLTAFDNCKYGLRTQAVFAPGEKGTITYRIVVAEENVPLEYSTYKYVPYQDLATSPSPNYPLAVNSITGENNLVIKNKNLFEDSEMYPSYAYNSTSTTNEDSSITIKSKGIYGYLIIGPYKEYLRGLTYTVSFDVDNMDNFKQVILFKSGWEVSGSSSDTNSLTFTIPSNYANNKLAIGIYPVQGKTITVSNIQVEVGDQATNYEHSIKKVYPISLGDIKLNGIGDYHDTIYKNGTDWYINKKIGVVDLSTFTFWRSATDGVDRYGIKKEIINMAIDNIISTHFNNDASPYTIGFGGVLSGTGGLYFDFAPYHSSDVDRFHQWLSKERPLLYYVKSNSSVEKITDSNLIEQLNNINNSVLFNGVNTVYFDNTYKAGIEIVY